MRSLLRRFAPRSGALLHSLKGAWALRPDDCPCDIHFVDWMVERGAVGETVFHFGTGGHHYVGVKLGETDLGVSIMGVTATSREYDSYIDLVTHRPELARTYCVYFGDIYTANPALMPTYDVVTLFHLCEFRTEENDAYGALTDLELIRVFAGRTRPGGRLVFYTGSYAYAQAEPIIAEWAAAGAFEEVEGFRSLRVFRKVGAG